MMMQNCGKIFLFVLACMAIVLYVMYAYLCAWYVFWNEYVKSDRTCDKPLGSWLGNYLLITVLGSCCGKNMSPTLKRVLTSLKYYFLFIGYWYTRDSETCEETNPELFRFVRWFVLLMFKVELAMGKWKRIRPGCKLTSICSDLHHDVCKCDWA